MNLLNFSSCLCPNLFCVKFAPFLVLCAIVSKAYKMQGEMLKMKEW